MYRQGLLAACLFALDALAATVQRRATVSHRWQRQSLAHRDSSIKLHIALRHEDGGAAIERQLLLASDPGNTAAFRNHLGAAEAAALSQPAAESVREVESWLDACGLAHAISLRGGIYEIDTSIRHVEALLNTTYSIFSDGLHEIVRTELFHLPASIARHLDFITPTTNFPEASDSRISARRAAPPILHKRADNNSCSGTDALASPTCVRQAYNISFAGFNYTATPNRTTFAVYATEGASFNNSDLQQYLATYNPAAAQASASYQIIGSGDAQNKGGIEPQFETALDTQTLLGLAWPAQGLLYNVGGVFGPDKGKTYDPFVTFLHQLITNDSIPSVISFSESAPENLFDPDYLRRVCNMLAQIGTRGTSLIFSSGNNGANGDQAGGEHKAIFEPKFPASCPWITSSGGTTNFAAEEAATKSTIPPASALGFTASGGGFSNVFPRPHYQAVKVDSYVNTSIPANYTTQSGFNASGRGYPDVAAFSTQFPTLVSPYGVVPIGGTSAAAPVWAAVVALLNDYETSHGRPTLGFLNPWLYSLDSGLRDITTGGNNAGSCDAAQGCTLGRVEGFNVTAGWDAVTGLGSPEFGALVEGLERRAGGDNNSADVEFLAAARSASSTAGPAGSATSSGMATTATSSTTAGNSTNAGVRSQGDITGAMYVGLGVTLGVALLGIPP